MTEMQHLLIDSEKPQITQMLASLAQLVAVAFGDLHRSRFGAAMGD